METSTMSETAKTSLEVVEVGPRDGLQALRQAVPTELKVELIGLAPNERGALRALAAGVDELGTVCAASDAFGFANQGATSAASVERACRMIEIARAEHKPAQATIAVAFGCPYTGEVKCERVIDIARTLAASGAREVAIADTIGVATPQEAARVCREIRGAIAPIPVRAHFHDTHGAGVRQCVGGLPRRRAHHRRIHRRTGGLSLRAGRGGQRIDRTRGLLVRAQRRCDGRLRTGARCHCTLAPRAARASDFSSRARGDQPMSGGALSGVCVLEMQGGCPRLSLTPSALRSPPLTVGQHNAEIYGRRLGLSAEELSSFAALGVI